jgi:hypothetical protein
MCFLVGPGDELIATHFIPFLQEKMSNAAQPETKLESISLITELISKYANANWTNLLENLMSETS